MQVVNDAISFESGVHTIDGWPVQEIVDQVGTPCYLYSASGVRRSCATARRATKGFRLLYSVKANPFPPLLELLASICDGADVSSVGEIGRASDAGFSPDTLSYTGPGKRETDLSTAVTGGVGMISVDSCAELSSLAELCIQETLLLLRLNPEWSPDSAGERMGGVPSQFGIDLEGALRLAATKPHLFDRIGGVHVYCGSQILSAQDLRATLDEVVDVVESLRSRGGKRFAAVGVGGGWGVPYCSTTPGLDMDAVRTAYSWAWDRLSRCTTAAFIELGRFLVADSGIYVARVVDVKDSRGVRYVITDGGLNSFLRPAFVGTTHPVCLLSSRSSRGTDLVTVVGSLCTPLDVLARDIPLSAVRPGDLLGILKTGAYGHSMSPSHFLTRPVAAEALVSRKSLQVVYYERSETRSTIHTTRDETVEDD